MAIGLKILAVLSVFLPAVASAEVFSKKEMIQQLKSRSHKLELVRSLGEEARAKVKQANSISSPQISIASQEFLGRVNQIEFGFIDPGTLGFFTFGSTALQALYMVYDPTQASKLEAAGYYLKSAEEQVAFLTSELSFQCFALYIQAQKFDVKMKSLNTIIVKDKELVEIAKTKFKSGLGMELDVMRANNLLLADELKKVDLGMAVKRIKNDLKNIVVQMDETQPLEELTYSVLRPEDVRIDENWVEKRADIRSLKYQVQSVSLVKQSLEREWLPKVSFFGNVGFGGSHVYGGFGSAATGMLGLRISMPIFTGGLNDGKTEEQGVKWLQASTNLSQTELESKNQHRLSTEYLSEAKLAVETAKKNLAATEEEIRIVKTKFKLGAINWFDYASSNKNYLNAIDLEIDAVAGYELAKLQFFRSLGNIEGYLKEELKSL